jgi:dTMP kinase
MIQPKFISFEGIEGVGKSSNMAFFAECIREKGFECVCTREPGGTPLAEKVRSILLSDFEEKVMPKTEALLLYAGRLQHVESLIKPSLAEGKWVLCDRFFDASMAYQGGGRGIDLKQLKDLNQWVLGDFKPDMTILFDAPAEVGLERASKRSELDRFEKENIEFFNKIRNMYLTLAKAEPERFKIIDASLSLEEVQKALLALLAELS